MVRLVYISTKFETIDHDDRNVLTVAGKRKFSDGQCSMSGAISSAESVKRNSNSCHAKKQVLLTN